MLYRGVGLLRNDIVQIHRRTVNADGSCGTVPTYSLFLERYRCRLYFDPEEKTRDAMGEERKGAWTMFGNDADIREGDRIVRDGQTFTVTSIRRPRGRRVKNHLKAILRRDGGASSSH